MTALDPVPYSWHWPHQGAVGADVAAHQRWESSPVVRESSQRRSNRYADGTVSAHNRLKRGKTMIHTFRRLLMLYAALCAALLFVTPTITSAQDCTGAITTEDAMKAEMARYAAQTSDDFAALGKMLGGDLAYNHSSGAMDDKQKYIENLRAGRPKFRKITLNSDVTTRTYGCVAIISGMTVYEVTAGGQDRKAPLRFTAVWVKRPSGLEFVSWQSTGIRQ